jgi:formylglycine-generating enzyme required for sulfatase activity
MGSNEGRRDEQPVHEVCINRPFWLDRTEVTNTQFGSHGAFDGPDHPRENLTWYEARDFCRSRGGRLPSEAEWEYAARGVDSWRYPWGDSLYENRLVFDRNNNNQTAPVLSRPLGASWVGALGMAGNVWEWVNSAYLPYPYQAEDGRESDNPPDPRRVYRGGLGSYIDNAVTASARFRGDPHKRDWFIGFRCVKDIE